MRILKIRVQNINSLKGNWEVDFEDPAYSAGGLFAICGPTGAGKSSLLDAVCIALYGQTPRLGALSAGANEAMSRGSGLLESEVTFLAKGIRYRALYSQRRARQKADGRLQGAAVELSQWNPDTQCWDILEGKYKKSFDEKIESITGLSFAQFTRSVLLAQGSFSIFLKAKEDERSDALEALTGTELYSQISQKVYERHKAEQAALEQLKAEAGATSVLSDEALAELNAKIAAAQTELTGQTAALRAKEALRDRVLERDKTAEALTHTTSELESLSQTLRDLQAERLTTETAQKALAVRPAHTALTESRTRLSTLEKSEATITYSLSGAQELLKKAQAAFAPAQDNSRALTQALEELAPTLSTVRRLDTLLTQQRKTLAEKEAEQKREDEALRQSLAKSEADKSRAQALSDEIAHLTQESAPASRGARVYARQAEITAALTQYEKGEAARSRRRAALTATQTKLTAAQAERDKARQALAPLTEALEAARRALSDTEAQREKVRAGQSLQVISQAKRQADERSLSLEALAQKAAQRDGQAAQHAQKKDELSKLGDTHKATDQALAKQTELVQACEQTLKAREETEALRSVVERLSLEREKLTDGSPCPLCGALHHPWRKHAPAILSEDAQALTKAREALAKAQAELTRLTAQRATLDGNLAAARSALEAMEKDAAALSADIAARAEALALARALPNAAPETLETALKDAKALSANLTERLTQLSQLEDRRSAQTQTMTQAQSRLEVQSKALQEAELKAREAAAAHATAQAELANAEATAQAAHEALQAVCAGLVVPPADASVLEAWHRRLQKVIRLHEERLSTLAERKAQAASLTSSLAEQAAQQSQCRERLTALRTAAETIKSECGATQEERIRLFGPKNPDEEERALKAARDKAVQDCEAQRALVQRHTEAVTTLTGQLSAAREQRRTEQTHAAEALAAWDKARVEAGFADEAAWSGALLSEEEVQARLAKYTRLTTQKETLTRSAAALEAKLTAIKEGAESELLLSAVEQEVDALRAAVSNLTEQKGILTAERRGDALARERLAEKLTAVQKQQEALAVWANLNSLIGSSDGKAYRTFVQSMTFETLLYYANRALEKISPRYRLKKDEAKPLQLNVIDAYQGGVERSAENLSGGESFLVSLSLALGLSEMAGRNVRVESLFLDEGFGSLDPDTLEDAMNALAALQSQGKMIGIISHVGEVRERIPTIIEVTPLSGGVSELSGPGVRRL